MGRPAGGGGRRSGERRVQLRVAADVLETIDAAAEKAGETRTEYLVGAGLMRAAEELRNLLTPRQRKAIAREISRYVLEDLEL